jgi:hypothetical protein
MSNEHKKTTNSEIGANWESDLVYNNLAEILSAKRPIEDPEEAFNCASTLGDVVHFLKNVTSSMELGVKDRSAISEILSAMETVAKRITEWEGRALGIDTPTTAHIKYIGRKANSAIE